MEREVLTNFYKKLVCILPVDSILYDLVPARIVTTDDVENIKHMLSSKDKASFILQKIDRSLEAKFTDDFHVLLDMLEECGNDDVKGLVRDIRQTINNGEQISYVVIANASNCMHSYTSYIASY